VETTIRANDFHITQNVSLVETSMVLWIDMDCVSFFSLVFKQKSIKSLNSIKSAREFNLSVNMLFFFQVAIPSYIHPHHVAIVRIAVSLERPKTLNFCFMTEHIPKMANSFTSPMRSVWRTRKWIKPFRWLFICMDSPKVLRVIRRAAAMRRAMVWALIKGIHLESSRRFLIIYIIFVSFV
jgi:hypothetical protein